MQIRVLFFGILKDLSGRSSEALTVPDDATAGSVLEHYERQFPSLQGSLSSIAISINQQYARPDDKLRAGDEVALLPPVSGGASSGQNKAGQGRAGQESPTHASGEAAGDEPVIKLIRERIVPHDIISALERPEDGAIVIFDGVVRNHSRGRRTLYLDYEAYEKMATRQLRQLATEARERFAIRNLAIVHRLGRIEIGESSVLIAVFSAHRAAAFDACRWLIDTLKRTVPIWKKEYFEDGAIWADGERFPDDIAPQLERTAHPTK